MMTSVHAATWFRLLVQAVCASYASGTCQRVWGAAPSLNLALKEKQASCQTLSAMESTKATPRACCILPQRCRLPLQNA